MRRGSSSRVNFIIFHCLKRIGVVDIHLAIWSLLANNPRRFLELFPTMEIHKRLNLVRIVESLCELITIRKILSLIEIDIVELPDHISVDVLLLLLQNSCAACWLHPKLAIAQVNTICVAV